MSYENKKDVQQKLEKIFSNIWNWEKHFQKKLGPEIFKNKSV